MEICSWVEELEMEIMCSSNSSIMVMMEMIIWMSSVSFLSTQVLQIKRNYRHLDNDYICT